MTSFKTHLSLRERAAYHSLEDVVGCKWSAGVVAALSDGICRPSALERYLPGISTKVLNERLRKLMAYGLITRQEHPGLPSRVEYGLTDSGRKLATILIQLRDLNAEHRAGALMKDVDTERGMLISMVEVEAS